MQELKARFSLLDDMSAQIERIAEAGMEMVEQFEDAGSAAGDAFSGIESGVATAAGSVDGVATSIGNVQSQTGRQISPPPSEIFSRKCQRQSRA